METMSICSGCLRNSAAAQLSCGIWSALLLQNSTCSLAFCGARCSDSCHLLFSSSHQCACNCCQPHLCHNSCTWPGSAGRYGTAVAYIQQGRAAPLETVSTAGDRLTLSRAWQCPVPVIRGIWSRDTQAGSVRSWLGSIRCVSQAPSSAEAGISVSESSLVT